MLDLSITIPGQAISANALYKRGHGGQVFLAPEATRYRKEAREHVQRALKRSEPYSGGVLHAEITVHQKYFNDDNSIKNVDLDNSLKNLLDSIFPVLGFSDSTIFDIRLKKVHTRLKPKCQIRIWETPLPKLANRSLKEVIETTKSFLSSTQESPTAEWRSAFSTQTEQVSMFQEGQLGKTFNRF